jgi:hypothetical protein
MNLGSVSKLFWCEYMRAEKGVYSTDDMQFNVVDLKRKERQPFAFTLDVKIN